MPTHEHADANSDGKCDRCGERMTGGETGKPDEGTGSDDPEVTTDPYTRDGDVIFFGAYPQTLVESERITSLLNERAGEAPNEYNSRNWTSYGYYYNNKTTPDYMWYIDVEMSGSMYRGVYFTKWRPWFSTSKSGYQQYNNGYAQETVYWFRYDPIKWRVLTETDGKALLFSELILDSHEYYHGTSGTPSFEHNGGTGYASNYALSEPVFEAPRLSRLIFHLWRK